MGDTDVALAAAIAVIRAFAGRLECLPGDSRRVINPGFFRLGIAATCLPLFDDVTAGLVQPGIYLFQFVAGLRLDAEMIQTRLPTASGDSEIDTRIVEHPFCVIRFDNCRPRSKQRRIEADGLL